MKRILISLVLVAPLALPVPGRAANLSVAVKDNVFQPDMLTASLGDTVTWTWGGVNGHSVTAYSGATFDSGVKTTGTFQTTFGGKTIWYRCTVHSYPSSTYGWGGWAGMIGVITDPPPTLRVNAPRNGDVVSSPVTVEGDATDNQAVGSVKVEARYALLHPLVMGPRVNATCTACPGPSVTWRAVLNLPPGYFAIVVTARDTNSNSVTATIFVTVLPVRPG